MLHTKDQKKTKKRRKKRKKLALLIRRRSVLISRNYKRNVSQPEQYVATIWFWHFTRVWEKVKNIIFLCNRAPNNLSLLLFLPSTLASERSFCVKWLRILPCNCLLFSCYDEIFRWCSHKSNQFVCGFLRNALKLKFCVKIFIGKDFLKLNDFLLNLQLSLLVLLITRKLYKHGSNLLTIKISQLHSEQKYMQ